MTASNLINDVNGKWIATFYSTELLSKALYIASHSPIHPPSAVAAMQGNNRLVGSRSGVFTTQSPSLNCHSETATRPPMAVPGLPARFTATMNSFSILGFGGFVRPMFLNQGYVSPSGYFDDGLQGALGT